MATDKKSVLLYCDIIHTVESLEDSEAGKLFKHYLRYINDKNPTSDRLTELLFEPIKQNLKRDLKKWESKSGRNSLIAKEGWIKRKEANESERIKQDAINADKVIVTVKDNVKVKDTVTVKVKEINIPPLQEFLEYSKEKSGNDYESLKKSLELKYKKLIFILRKQK